MRKCLVTLAIGEKHLGIENVSRSLREHYASRHGYDYRVITKVSDLSTKSELPADIFPAGSEKLSFLAANLLKLFLPRTLDEYDFAVYMDADTMLNPNAPCLSSYEPQIPQSGFAAVQTVTNDLARRFFPLWAGDYYLACEQKGSVPPLVNRDLYINGGLFAFRPREVAATWSNLVGGKEGFHEENLLNMHEVQNGRCLPLPPQWNVLWYYKKHYMGWLKPANSWTSYQFNRIKNRAAIGEKWLVNRCFAACHMMHFAFEHKKMRFIDPEKWLPKS